MSRLDRGGPHLGSRAHRLPRHVTEQSAAADPAPGSSHRPSRRPRLCFRGWLVVAGAFLVVMVGYGAIYSYAAYAEEIAAEFASPRTSVALVYGLSGGTCFFVSAISGPLADRLGPRVLAFTGMLLVGLGLAVAAAATTMIEVFVGYGLLIGIGVGFAYVPAVATVQRWFVIHRGSASGIAVSGIGIGTALVPPVSEALSVLGNWRVAFAISGGLAVIVGIGGALLLDPSPERHGLAPDGVRRPAAQRALVREPAPPGIPRALGARPFALAYVGTLLVSLPVTLPYALLVATARDLGLSRHDAVALLGLIGLGSIAGRFLLAALADMAGRRITFLGCCTGVVATTLVWSLAEELVLLQVFALGFGAAQGGFVALLPAFVADCFGSRSVGGVLGVLYTSRGVALVVAPPGLAIGIAVLGGHAVPVAAAAALGALGTLLLASVRVAAH